MRMKAALQNVGTMVVFRVGRDDAEDAARRIGATDPATIKHGGGARAIHPLYAPLAEQWEGWTAAIQRLKPRQMFVRRSPPQGALARLFHAPVAKLRTPDLPDPVVDPRALAAVEDRYLMDAFEVQPIVAAELAALRPTVPVPVLKRRTRIA